MNLEAIQLETVNFDTWFTSQEPSLPLNRVHHVLKLMHEGATIPFIARYRKEMTGGFNEVDLEKIQNAKETWETLSQRKKHILSEIEKQGALNESLKKQIITCIHLETLEDLYLPYKQKKKTKATLAKEGGLAPLADWLWNATHGGEIDQNLEDKIQGFQNEIFKEPAQVLQGSIDILTERISENATLRGQVRQLFFQKGFLTTAKGSKVKPNSKYEKYFEYSESISSLQKPANSHRYLAMKRGWVEEELQLFIGAEPQDKEFDPTLLSFFTTLACPDPKHPLAEALLKAAELAMKNHVIPSIQKEVHRALKVIADTVAIEVFANNLRDLLLTPPFGSKTVLGVDPGIRTGCKLALVEGSGKFLANHVIYLQQDEQKELAKKVLKEVLTTIPIDAIAIGNGTAGKETLLFFRKTLKELGISIPLYTVNEAGASVYSTSEVAREEFPDLDATVRSTISIARRFQDPLAELVKIDPKSIGVGQYQHDVSANQLKKTLQLVVESCVHSVGVNINTASEHLLQYISGIGPSTAKAIIDHRKKEGIFKSRQELQKIPGMNAKTYELAVGFLRVPDSAHPLDNTGVHPEHYSALESWIQNENLSWGDVLGENASKLREATGLLEKIGAFTLEDVIADLEKPGRDPREEFVPFQFREDIFELGDLKENMECPGVVTNVTNFGAFVDIGVHQDGLVHLSQITNRFIKDPREELRPGDRVQVRILSVNLEKSQIALSMKPPAPPKPKFQPKPKAAHQEPRQFKGKPKKPFKPKGPPKPKFSHQPFAALASLKGSLKKEE